MNKIKSFLAICLFILSGCAMDTQGVKDESKLPYVFSQFSDIPVPENANMSLDDTSIYGRENDWVGKIAFTAPYSVSGIFDFYMNEMPKFGWTEFTSVRAANSVLTYVRDSRVALIQLIPSNFQGTQIFLTVSPRPSPKDISYAVQKNRRKKEVRYVSKDGKNANKDPNMKQKLKDERKKHREELKRKAEEEKLAKMKAENKDADGKPRQEAPKTSTDKSQPGSLGLKDASNMNYESKSKGVGKPPAL